MSDLEERTPKEQQALIEKAERTYQEEAESTYKKAKLEWLEVLAELWEAFGKPIDKARVKIYARDLAYVPLDLLERAVRLANRAQSFNMPPTIRAVEDALCDILLVDRFTNLENYVDMWSTGKFESSIVRFNSETIQKEKTQ